MEENPVDVTVVTLLSSSIYSSRSIDDRQEKSELQLASTKRDNYICSRLEIISDLDIVPSGPAVRRTPFSHIYETGEYTEENNTKLK